MRERLLKIGRVRVLIAGDVMLDRYIWGDVRRISPEAPVPVVHVQRRTWTPGGAGNVALNLRGLGCQAHLFGVRGEDAEGEQLANLLKDNGIGGELLAVSGRPTTTKTRVMGQNQQLIRIDDETAQTIPNAVEERLMEAISPEFSHANAIVLSDYGKGVLTGSLAGKIIKAASALGLPVFIDPKGKQWDRYRGATCLTPNWPEFLSYLGIEKLDERALEHQAKIVIDSLDLQFLLITRGAAGMVLFSKEGLIHQLAAQAREVYDVSGAGDTVVATLTASHAGGFDMAKAADLANTSAGIVVAKVGTRPITLPELETALKNRSIIASGKVYDVSGLTQQVSLWRTRGERIVFTNGCFDILHMGHVDLLQSAAQLGDRLIIGLNSDTSIRRLKGNARPVLPEGQRAGLLAALECVDAVVIFGEDTPLETILAIHPDILVKGADYEGKFIAGRREIEAWGGRVALIAFSHDVSTSQIIEGLRTR